MSNDNETLVCPICGAPTRVYMGNARRDRLCGKHADELKAGRIKLLPNGKYVFCDKQGNPVPEKTDNTKFKDKQKENKIESVKEYKTNKCIICGNETESDYLFCKQCYFKYKGKTILLRITDCTNIELLDATYEGAYTCTDGHVVKSKSELAIDNYLFEQKIAHSYEQAYPIDNNPEHDLHPDFYLPELDLYIEHWGYDDSNRKYTETKNYKLPIYEKDGITLLSTTEKDMSNINAALSRKLKFYEKGKIND